MGYGVISPITPLGQFIASFVMILGYGIIAVPTGIVTAEYLKSDKSKTTTKEEYLRVSPHCMTKHQALHANYCYNCYEEL